MQGVWITERFYIMKVLDCAGFKSYIVALVVLLSNSPLLRNRRVLSPEMGSSTGLWGTTWYSLSVWPAQAPALCLMVYNASDGLMLCSLTAIGCCFSASNFNLIHQTHQFQAHSLQEGTLGFLTVLPLLSLWNGSTFCLWNIPLAGCAN